MSFPVALILAGALIASIDFIRRRNGIMVAALGSLAGYELIDKVIPSQTLPQWASDLLALAFLILVLVDLFRNRGNVRRQSNDSGKL